MPKGNKRPIGEKRPDELTDDEAMEHLFSEEVREEAKRVAHKAEKPDRYKENSSHK